MELTSSDVRLTAAAAVHADLDAWRGQILEVCPESTGAAYAQGHLPGAAWASWRELFWDGWRRSLCGSGQLRDRLHAAGFDLDRPLLLYSQPVQFAAYGMWAVAALGADCPVVFLDGGKKAWREVGGRLAVGAEPGVGIAAASAGPGPASGPLPRPERHWAGREELLNPQANQLVIDLRSAVEYAGLQRAPDPASNGEVIRGGRISGARSLPHSMLLDPTDRILGAAGLAQVFATRTGHQQPAPDCILYCRSGHRSALGWLALTERLQWPSVRVYEGAWLEWANLHGAPIERG